MINYGGKANSLIELKKKYNVPKFNVITFDYFDHYINDNKINVSNLTNVKSEILNGNFSVQDENKIHEIFDELNAIKVSVRSSALVEDSINNSWAGLFDSCLFVTRNKLIESVKKVYASLYNERAIKYKSENQVSDKDYKMCVIIQQMIDPDISGVSFSKNGSTNTDCILIQACLETGDKLVSGQVNPNTYYVRNDLIIKDEINKINITDNQIMDIANKTKQIEKDYKIPVDIEFCFKNNILYILQARPITKKIHTSKFLTIKKYLELSNYSYPINSKWPLFSKTMSDMANNKLYKNIEGCSYSIQVYKDNEYYRIYNGYRPKPNYSKEEIIKLLKDNFILIDSIMKKVDMKIFTKNYLEVKKYVINFINEYLEVFISEANIRYILNSYYEDHKMEEDELAKLSNKWRNDTSHDDIFINFLFDTICYYGFNDYKDLVFEFISYDEFIKMLDNNYNIIDFVHRLEQRKKNGYLSLNIPFMTNKVIDSKSKVSAIKNIIDMKYYANLNDVKGNPVTISNKIITGECIVIKQDEDLNNEIDLNNKIIVSTMTTPYFVTYLKNVKGIITDVGGILSHASIISREMNIPAIVGTINATKKIKTGQIVSMNMSTGKISINN